MESVTCECGWWKVINVLGSSSHAMPCVITSWRFHYHYYHNLLNNTCCFNIHREINIVTEFIVLSYLPGSSGRPESHSNKLAHTEGQKKIQTCLTPTLPRIILLQKKKTLLFQNLWLPDVEILDLKAFETHSVLSKLEGWESGGKEKWEKTLKLNKHRRTVSTSDFQKFGMPPFWKWTCLLYGLFLLIWASLPHLLTSCLKMQGVF